MANCQNLLNRTAVPNDSFPLISQLTHSEEQQFSNPSC
jgi:hypothetical protein